MNDGPMGEDDEARLLAALGAALEPDDLPAGLLERATGLVELLDVDHDLAALLDEAPELVGSRGTATGDRLSFASADGAVAVDVVTSGGRISGQVLAGEIVLVVLEGVHAAAGTAAVDDLGRFGFEAAGGPLRLRLRTATGPDDVVTDWFLS